MNRSKKPDETVCVTGTQMEHIIDAAREEKGSCPKAKSFVNSFRPKKTDSSPLLVAVDKKIDRQLSKWYREFQRWF